MTKKKTTPEDAEAPNEAATPQEEFCDPRIKWLTIVTVAVVAGGLTAVIMRDLTRPEPIAQAPAVEETVQSEAADTRKPVRTAGSFGSKGKSKTGGQGVAAAEEYCPTDPIGFGLCTLFSGRCGSGNCTVGDLVDQVGAMVVTSTNVLVPAVHGLAKQCLLFVGASDEKQDI